MTLPNNVALRLVTDPDSYVSADTDSPTTQMIANRAAIGPREEFIVEPLTDDVYALRASTGEYVQVKDNNKLYPDGTDKKDVRCQFKVVQASGGAPHNVTLRSMKNNKYWSVREDDSKWLECSATIPKSWETFLYRGLQG